MTQQITRHARGLQRFRTELGPLWPRLQPLCLDLGTAGVGTLLASTRHTAARADTPLGPLAGDLEALLAGWPHYDADERAVLHAAVTYLEDAVARETAGLQRRGNDVARVDDVVDATIRTVLRA